MSGMNGHSLAGDMMKYIDASPTPFHMCAESSAMLLAAGFVELQETDAWRPLLKPGGSYFYVRGGVVALFYVCRVVALFVCTHALRCVRCSPNLAIARHALPRSVAAWRAIGARLHSRSTPGLHLCRLAASQKRCHCRSRVLHARTRPRVEL